MAILSFWIALPSVQENRWRYIASSAGLIAVLFASALATPLLACPPECPRVPDSVFSAIYVFGDSLSDTGRAAAVLHPAPPPTTDWVNGRESNGPLWIEQISPVLGLRYNPATNFAWCGATSGFENTNGPLPLLGTMHQAGMFLGSLPDSGADPDALYVVFAGSNDFLKVLRGEASASSLAETVANLVTIVGGLRMNGAEHIVLVDVPNIGLTPRVKALEKDMPGVSAYVSDACRDFNTALLQTLDDYDLPVIHVSAFDVVTDCVAHPRRYGFTNVDSVAMPDTHKARTYMFWSDIHPSARLHGWLGVAILEKLRDEGLLRRNRTPSCWRPILVPR